jgi:hypothetical protein
MKHIKLIFILIVVNYINLTAQWIQTGPATGQIKIVENNNNLYSTNAIGFHKSTDNGVTWSRISSFAGFTMNNLIFTSNKMLASTNKGVFYSIDGGVTWTSSNQGLSGTDTTGGIGSIYLTKLHNNRVLTMVNSGAYYSDNEGQTWNLISNSIFYYKVLVVGNYILATDGLAFFTTNDNGLTWQNINSTGLPASTTFTEILFVNNTYYINGNNIHIYKSTDNGITWISNNNGITGTTLAKFYTFNDRIFKKTTTGVFELNTSSNQWEININLSPNFILCGYNDNRYFSYEYYNFDGVLYSDNDLVSWSNCIGVNCMLVKKISVSEQLYALWDIGGYEYDSTQINFSRASPYNTNYSSNTYIQYGVFDIKKSTNGNIYIGTAGGVWKSTNNGLSYNQFYNGIPASGATQTRNVYDMYISGAAPNDTLFAATDGGIYMSLDEAQNFTLVNGTSGNKMQQFLKYQSVLYCAGTKIYKQTIGNVWNQFTTFTNTGILGFAAADNYLFVTTANSPLKYAHINGLSNFANITSGSPGFAHSVAGYDTLVFYYSNSGVYKLNTSLLGNATSADLVQVADNLPYYENPGGWNSYS